MTSASSIPSTSGSGGEKKIPVVTDFFLKDLEKDVWVCQVKTGDNAEGEPQRCLCKLSVSADSHKGTRAYNRKRHIRRSHMDVWDEWQQAEKEAEKRKALARKASHGLSTLSAAAGATLPSKQSTIKSFYTSDKVTVRMTKDIMKDAIVRMVAKEGVAVRFFSSASYKQANGALASSVGVSLERDQVTEYVIR